MYSASTRKLLIEALMTIELDRAEPSSAICDVEDSARDVQEVCKRCVQEDVCKRRCARGCVQEDSARDVQEMCKRDVQEDSARDVADYE